MFANFGPGHWAVLAVAMILLFGAKKLPDATRSLGKSLRIFKSELHELQTDGEPADAASPTAPAEPGPLPLPADPAAEPTAIGFRPV
ncbi:MAG: tatA 2 [Mycobacterium sp.]|jgi:sec-independent protein translocase protein TatA|nr:tatA 2 [Mycobacterium sp.]